MRSLGQPMTNSPANLADDTKVEKLDKVPGHYRARLPDHWNYFHPSGGALLTIALRAMTEELGTPALSLLSATTLFCAPILAGDLLVSVVVLRRGDTAAQVRASLTAKDLPGPGLEVLATFARDREGPDVHGVAMPSVRSPSECVAAQATLPSPEPQMPFYRNFEIAQAIGEPMWRPGWSKGEAHAAFWYRYRDRQRTEDGRFDPLALAPIADTMPPALVRRLGPEHPRLLAPSLDLTMYFLAPTQSEWILVESFAERARAGHAVCSANLWDEDGQLVARATQSMTLRPFKARAVRD